MRRSKALAFKRSIPFVNHDPIPNPNQVDVTGLVMDSETVTEVHRVHDFKKTRGIGLNLKTCGKLSRQQVVPISNSSQSESVVEDSIVAQVACTLIKDSHIQQKRELVKTYGTIPNPVILPHGREDSMALSQKPKRDHVTLGNKYTNKYMISAIENSGPSLYKEQQSETSGPSHPVVHVPFGTRMPNVRTFHAEAKNTAESSLPIPCSPVHGSVLQWQNNDTEDDQSLTCTIEEIIEEQEHKDTEKRDCMVLPPPTDDTKPAATNPINTNETRATPGFVTVPVLCGTYGSDNMYILDASGVLHKGKVDESTSTITYTSPSTMGSLSESYVWRISAGLAHFLVLDSQGKVHAWGENSYGQVGSSVNKQAEPVPVDVIPAGIVHIAAGHHFSLALDEAGTVWSWGHNDHGQLGHSAYDDCSRPCPIQRGSLFGRLVECITAGEAHALALDTLGQVHAWGDNRFGQLGNHRSSYKSATPIHVSAFGSLYTRFAALVAAGAHISLAVDVSGTLHAWGRLNASQVPGSLTLDSGINGSQGCKDYIQGKFWTPSVIGTMGIPASELISSVVVGSSYITVITVEDNVYTALINDTPNKGNVLFKKLNGIKASIITSLGVYAWGYLPLDCHDGSCWHIVVI